MTSQHLIQNNVILRSPRVANFADIIIIAAMIIKKTFKESNKVRSIKNYISKCNLDMHYLLI